MLRAGACLDRVLSLGWGTPSCWCLPFATNKLKAEKESRAKLSGKLSPKAPASPWLSSSHLVPNLHVPAQMSLHRSHVTMLSAHQQLPRGMRKRRLGYTVRGAAKVSTSGQSCLLAPGEG